MEGENEAAVVAEETPAAEPARNYEAEAREMGWVPETEFRGPKEKWKPADKFVEDGEKILPIVRSENKKLREELRLVREDFTTRSTRMERMYEANQQRLREEHEAKISEIKAAQVKAVEAGDTAEFRRLDAQRDKLQKAAPEEVAAAEPTQPPAFVDFKKANDWYGTEKAMTRYANSFSDALGEEEPTLSLAENLRRTEIEMRRMFPDKFPKKSAANGHAAVDGGGVFNGAPDTKSSLAAKLPAEALAQAKKDVASKLYKSVDDWAKVYYS